MVRATLNEVSSAEPARIGRPPKVDADGATTRERLLRCAVDAYAEHGYDGVTLAEIARRADVSTPAIYNHFSNRDELLVLASRAAMNGDLVRAQDRPVDLERTISEWTSKDAARGRRLLAELHLVSLRNEEIRDALGEWHRDRWDALIESGHNPAKVKAYFYLLLGLALMDSLDDLEADDEDVMAQVLKMAAALEPIID